MKNDICIIEPCAGLGNRLLCLYSILFWKEKVGREIKILWKKEPACNVDFLRLFEPIEGICVTETTQMGYKKPKYLMKSVISQIQETVLKRTYRFYPNRDMQQIYALGGYEQVEAVLKNTRKMFIKETGPFCSIDDMRSVKKALEPALHIRKEVDKVLAPFEGKELVGIHIRRTMDHMSIDMRFVELFAKKMKRMLEKNSQIVFYLTSDDEEVEKYFCNQKDFMVFIRPDKKLVRDEDEGMVDAYIDMLCLARCKKIVGSKHSTFSFMASFIGDSELYMIDKDDINI